MWKNCGQSVDKKSEIAFRIYPHSFPQAYPQAYPQRYFLRRKFFYFFLAMDFEIM